jgi:2-deoxy-D-gluconate 3-dehydrogenase
MLECNLFKDGSAMTKLFGIDGAQIFVTGGTGDIGSKLVGGFLSAGARVCVAARSREAITATATEFASHREKLSFVHCDLASDTSILHCVEEVRKNFGTIDTLLLAHGNVFPGPALDITLDSWANQIQVNLTATFRMAQAIAPQMIAKKRGKIITIASMLTFQGGLNASAYAASKGGVGQLTKALSNEWAPHGVNVNAIAPGYIKTKLNQHIWEDPERHKAVLARLPSGRWGEPNDLVGPALFLASPASDYLHGVILPVDGGWLSR